MLKKYFILFNILVFTHILHPQDEKILVSSKYPNAHAWYMHLAKKYPSAQLSKADFCISDHHHAGTDSIFWAEQNLIIINSWYGTSNLPLDVQKILQEDEYLLLHEASHVLNNDITKGCIAASATAVTGAVGAVTLSTQVATGAISAATAATQGVVGGAVIVAGLLTYIQSQEKQADDFANKTADLQALQAGAEWHKNNHDQLNIPQNSSKLEQTLIEFADDQTHPSPESRHNQAMQELEDRLDNPQAALA